MAYRTLWAKVDPLSTFKCPRQVSRERTHSYTIHYSFLYTLIAADYPIFIKGSNWVPMDAFVTRATPEYARSLLESAVAAHQNMIRIW